MPREVLKTCFQESFPINPTYIGILKNLGGIGGHLGFLKITSHQFLKILFKLSYEAILWQNQLKKKHL